MKFKNLRIGFFVIAILYSSSLLGTEFFKLPKWISVFLLVCLICVGIPYLITAYRFNRKEKLKELGVE